MFFGQGPLEFNAQRQLIQRLRRDDMPEPGELMRSVPTMRMLAQRYPQWLRMITSQDNFVRWNQAYDAVPAPQREAYSRRAAKQPAQAAPPTREPFQKQQSSFSPWWLVFAVVLMFSFFSRQTKSPAPPLNSASWSTPAQTPSQSGGFKPLYDLSPTDPVATSNARGLTTLEGRPVVYLQRGEDGRLKMIQPSDLGERQKEAEAALAKAIAEARSVRASAPAAGGGLATPKKAGSTASSVREAFEALGSDLPPDAGRAPRLSYELNRPADAASAPPSWQTPPGPF